MTHAVRVHTQRHTLLGAQGLCDVGGNLGRCHALRTCVGLTDARQHLRDPPTRDRARDRNRGLLQFECLRCRLLEVGGGVHLIIDALTENRHPLAATALNAEIDLFDPLLRGGERNACFALESRARSLLAKDRHCGRCCDRIFRDRSTPVLERKTALARAQTRIGAYRRSRRQACFGSSDAIFRPLEATVGFAARPATARSERGDCGEGNEQPPTGTVTACSRRVDTRQGLFHFANVADDPLRGFRDSAHRGNV